MTISDPDIDRVYSALSNPLSMATLSDHLGVRAAQVAKAVFDAEEASDADTIEESASGKSEGRSFRFIQLGP